MSVVALVTLHTHTNCTHTIHYLNCSLRTIIETQVAGHFSFQLTNRDLQIITIWDADLQNKITRIKIARFYKRLEQKVNMICLRVQLKFQKKKTKIGV